MKRLFRNIMALVLAGLLFVVLPMLMLQVAAFLLLLAIIVRLFYGPRAFRYYELLKQNRSRQMP